MRALLSCAAAGRFGRAAGCHRLLVGVQLRWASVAGGHPADGACSVGDVHRAALRRVPDSGTVVASVASDAYDLGSVRKSLREPGSPFRLLWSWPRRGGASSHRPKNTPSVLALEWSGRGGGHCAFVFSDGALVVWGDEAEAELPAVATALQSAEDHIDLGVTTVPASRRLLMQSKRMLWALPHVDTRQIPQHGDRRRYESTAYELRPTAGDEGASALDAAADCVVLPKDDGVRLVLQMLPATYALARTVKLDAFERQSEPLLDRLETWQKALLRENKLPQPARVLAIRAQLRVIRGAFGAGDYQGTPRLFWSDAASQEASYDELSAWLDNSAKAERVRTKLEDASSDAQFMADELHTAHSHRLELIIIYLILVEVVMGGFSLGLSLFQG